VAPGTARDRIEPARGEDLREAPGVETVDAAGVRLREGDSEQVREALLVPGEGAVLAL
jgi:hypothetical protein